MDIISESAEETTGMGRRFANSIIRKWKEGTVSPAVFCLYGGLGSGKTTFSQGFAQGLGLTLRLLSPTFLIVRRYQLPQVSRFLYHLDLYRTQSEKDFADIGLSEILTDKDSCILIEWAEKLGSFLPQERTDIYFTAERDGKHRIRTDSGYI